jgi:lipid-A-disaccharide synthase
MRVGLIAGEASGDLLAAGLIREIAARIPGARFEGVAGPAMQQAGCDKLAEAEELAVMGLVEPLRHIPRLLRLRKRLVNHWLADPPDVFVGIDAPDFNLGVEKRLRASGIPTVHYVSPSVWAWRSGRIKTIRRACDRVLCLLPFEKEFFDHHGVDAVFVGHPKASELGQDYSPDVYRKALALPETGDIVAILPGSRGSEVSRLAPAFIGAARLLAESRPALSFVLPVASPKLSSYIESALKASAMADRVHVVSGRSLDAMRAADVVLIASGTAVLEAALLGTPAVAAYCVAPFTAWLVRTFKLIDLEHFTIPNLLTDEPMIPEFIQEAATPVALAEAVAELLDDAPRRAAIREAFAKLHAELAVDADRRAAEAVIEIALREMVPSGTHAD